MTDGDALDLEPGSALPVPPDIDGTSHDVGDHDDRVSQTEDVGDVEFFNYDDDAADLVEGGGAEDQATEREPEGWPQDFWEPPSAEWPVSEPEPALNEAESKTLDAIVNQAVLGATLNDGLELPWETGVMASIFGDVPLAVTPQIPALTHSIDESKIERRETTEAEVEPAPKRQRGNNSTLRLYERVIRFKNSLTDHETDEAKWNRALEKLYAVVISSPGIAPTGVRLQDGQMELNIKQLRVLCGARSPNTVSKRATSLVNYCVWHRGFFYRKPPFPLDSEDVAEYIWEKHQDGMPYSTMMSFIESTNFAIHVLGLPLKRPAEPLVSAFTRGILEKASTTRPARKQARPLKVSEIILLEKMLNDEGLDVYDRYAAGAFLFAVYARCRWSDLRCIHGCELDINCSNDKLVGFISFSTFSHKTSAQVARHGLPMPLIAPIWGLNNPPWAMTWKKVAEMVSLDFSNFGRGAVLPAPNKAGKWGHRSVTTDEASKWLLELLKPHCGDLENVTSHSLKATTLSWLAKAGCDPHHRTILGHHSSGKGSLEVYSRDMLSAPLRTLEEVLRQIRIGALHPDLTRSGHIQRPSKHDCKDDPIKIPAEQPAQGGATSSSSSSSTSSTTSDDDETTEQQWLSLGDADPSVPHSAWGNYNMFQHEVSKIVHIEADSESCTFKCGMKASPEHKSIVSTAFLDSRKCKRCLKVVDSST